MFYLRYGRRFELNWFMVRKNKRHGMIERMKTMSEWGLSEQRPKLLGVRKAVKMWRRNGQSKH